MILRGGQFEAKF